MSSEKERNYKSWILELESLLLESVNNSMDPREAKFRIVELDKKYGSGSKSHIWENTKL